MINAPKKGSIGKGPNEKIGNITDNIKKGEIDILSQDTSPAYIQMYEISGQDTTTKHSFNRYIKDKEQDILINEQIMASIFLTNKIKTASKKERYFLIRQGLENPNIEIQKITAEMIKSAPEKEKSSLREIVFKKIEQGFENPNIEIQKIAAEMIRYAPEKEKSSLIKQALENPNIEIQKIAAEMIRYAPEKEKQNLFNLASKKGLYEEIIKPPLYDKKNIDKNTFSRQKFEKTGSGTTLIGGKLKNKVIIRHIKPEAFVTWQKIYEDHTTWKNKGFDYIPIEPILSYKLNKNGLVDVFSGILDLNLNSWIYKTKMFNNELIEQRDKIIQVITELGINHGHPHDWNFCLRFFRDKNGKIDLKHIPRLYLIDFDQAASPA